MTSGYPQAFTLILQEFWARKKAGVSRTPAFGRAPESSY